MRGTTATACEVAMSPSTVVKVHPVAEPKNDERRRRSSLSLIKGALTAEQHPKPPAAGRHAIGRVRRAKLVVGIALTYGDLLTDVLVCSDFFARGGASPFFTASVLFLALHLLVNALIVAFIFRQGLRDTLAALLGMKPALDTYRVFANAPPHRDAGTHTYTHDTILATTKAVESVFESFPQGFIQVSFLLTTPAAGWDALNLVSLVFSFCAIGFTLATGAVSMDRDETNREAAPMLHGFTGDATTALSKRVCLTGGLMAFFFGNSFSLVLALAASGDFLLIGALLACSFVLYLSCKIASGEYFFFLLPAEMWRRPFPRHGISVLWHVLMFSFVLAAPIPFFRLPGFVNTHVWVRVIASNLLVGSPLFLLAAYEWLPAHCGEAQSSNATYTAAGGGQASSCLQVGRGEVLAIWGCLSAISCTGAFVFWHFGMVKSFRGTFYRVSTYRELVRSEFHYDATTMPTGWTDEKIVELYMVRRDCSYWPKRIADTPVFKRALPGWPASEPEWMDDEWKASLPAKLWAELFGREAPAVPA